MTTASDLGLAVDREQDTGARWLMLVVLLAGQFTALHESNA
jgi:hypothetical protein